MSEEGIKRAQGMLEDSSRRARGRRLELTHVSGIKDGRTPVFVRNDKAAIADAQMKGLSPVLASENPKLEVPSGDKQADGTFVIGDVVLMETPTRLREQEHLESTRYIDNQIKAIKNRFHVEGQKAGVETFEEGANQLADADEAKAYSDSGRKLYAIGASFDKDGNLVRGGKVIAPGAESVGAKV